MISDNDDLIPMIEGLRAGDAQAAQLFCARFGPALIRVADRRLPGVVRRRVDPEDVVQSACRTFLRRARGGEFTLADSEGLWRLLCAITLTKVHEQTRFQLQKKEMPVRKLNGPRQTPMRVLHASIQWIEIQTRLRRLHLPTNSSNSCNLSIPRNVRLSI